MESNSVHISTSLTSNSTSRKQPHRHRRHTVAHGPQVIDDINNPMRFRPHNFKSPHDSKSSPRVFEYETRDADRRPRSCTVSSESSHGSSRRQPYMGLSSKKCQPTLYTTPRLPPPYRPRSNSVSTETNNTSPRLSPVDRSSSTEEHLQVRAKRCRMDRVSNQHNNEEPVSLNESMTSAELSFLSKVKLEEYVTPRRSSSRCSMPTNLDLNDSDHQQFRSKLRFILGLYQDGSKSLSSGSSLQFRSPHKSTTEKLHHRLRRVLNNKPRDCMRFKSLPSDLIEFLSLRDSHLLESSQQLALDPSTQTTCATTPTHEKESREEDFSSDQLNKDGFYDTVTDEIPTAVLPNVNDEHLSAVIDINIGLNGYNLHCNKISNTNPIINKSRVVSMDNCVKPCKWKASQSGSADHNCLNYKSNAYSMYTLLSAGSSNKNTEVINRPASEPLSSHSQQYSNFYLTSDHKTSEQKNVQPDPKNVERRMLICHHEKCRISNRLSCSLPDLSDGYLPITGISENKHIQPNSTSKDCVQSFTHKMNMDEEKTTQNKASVRLSSYGFVISEKSNRPSATVKPVSQDTSAGPTNLPYRELSLVANSLSPYHDPDSPSKHHAYFLQFDTPQTGRSRSRKRTTTGATERKIKLRKSRSTPRIGVKKESEHPISTLSRSLTTEDVSTDGDTNREEITKETMKQRSVRTKSSSPSQGRKSSVADSISRFKELQQRRRELMSPPPDVVEVEHDCSINIVESIGETKSSHKTLHVGNMLHDTLSDTQGSTDIPSAQHSLISPSTPEVLSLLKLSQENTGSDLVQRLNQINYIPDISSFKPESPTPSKIGDEENGNSSDHISENNGSELSMKDLNPEEGQLLDFEPPSYCSLDPTTCSSGYNTVTDNYSELAESSSPDGLILSPHVEETILTEQSCDKTSNDYETPPCANLPELVMSSVESTRCISNQTYPSNTDVQSASDIVPPCAKYGPGKISQFEASAESPDVAFEGTRTITMLTKAASTGVNPGNHSIISSESNLSIDLDRTQVCSNNGIDSANPRENSLIYTREDDSEASTECQCADDSAELMDDEVKTISSSVIPEETQTSSQTMSADLEEQPERTSLDSFWQGLMKKERGSQVSSGASSVLHSEPTDSLDQLVKKNIIYVDREELDELCRYTPNIEIRTEPSQPLSVTTINNNDLEAKLFESSEGLKDDSDIFTESDGGLSTDETSNHRSELSPSNGIVPFDDVILTPQGGHVLEVLPMEPSNHENTKELHNTSSISPKTIIPSDYRAAIMNSRSSVSTPLKVISEQFTNARIPYRSRVLPHRLPRSRYPYSETPSDEESGDQITSEDIYVPASRNSYAGTSSDAESGVQNSESYMNLQSQTNDRVDTGVILSDDEMFVDSSSDSSEPGHSTLKHSQPMTISAVSTHSNSTHEFETGSEPESQSDGESLILDGSFNKPCRRSPEEEVISLLNRAIDSNEPVMLGAGAASERFESELVTEVVVLSHRRPRISHHPSPTTKLKAKDKLVELLQNHLISSDSCSDRSDVSLGVEEKLIYPVDKNTVTAALPSSDITASYLSVESNCSGWETDTSRGTNEISVYESDFNLLTQSGLIVADPLLSLNREKPDKARVELDESQTIIDKQRDKKCEPRLKMNDSTTEAEILSDDNWKLSENDESALEDRIMMAVSQLDPLIASDEDSVVGANSSETKDSSPRRQISAPTSFPSNFTTVRSGKATELFEERMKAHQEKQSQREKKFMPVVATIGKFSSAFKKFETDREDRRSSVGSIPTSQAISAQKSSVSASLEFTSRRPRDSDKKLASVNSSDIPSPDENLTPSSKPEKVLKSEARLVAPKSPSKRSANLPIDCSRTIKPLREATNTQNEISRLSRANQPPNNADQPVKSKQPHFDVDIVIKREPLPDNVHPDMSSKPPTTEITLGKDEVKVMKISTYRSPVLQDEIDSDDVMNIWDTDVPIRDTSERVIQPTRLHVSKMSYTPDRVASPGDTHGTPSDYRAFSPPRIISAPVGQQRQPLRSKSEGRTNRIPVASQEPISVVVRPQLQISQNPPMRAGSSDDILSPKMRSSLAVEPSSTYKSAAQPQKPQSQRVIRQNAELNSLRAGSSLEDLRQGNLVAHAKDLFSPAKSGRCYDQPDESEDYTRRWVEQAEPSNTSQISNNAHSPRIQQVQQNQPWFMVRKPTQQTRSGLAEEEPTSRQRSRVSRGSHGLYGRSKSLPRKPSSQIAGMASFFQSASDAQKAERIMNEIDEDDTNPIRSNVAPTQRQPGRTKRVVNQRKAPAREQGSDVSPKGPADGVNRFIQLYNSTDVGSRFDNGPQMYEEQISPRDAPPQHSSRSRRHDHERPRRPQSSYERSRDQPDSRDSSLKKPVKQTASEPVTPVDDLVESKSLTATAWNAWLGGGQKSSLEEKIENAYQRHQVLSPASNRPAQHENISRRKSAPNHKNLPWWKLQNEQAEREKRQQRGRSPTFSDDQSPRYQQRSSQPHIPHQHSPHFRPTNQPSPQTRSQKSLDRPYEEPLVKPSQAKKAMELYQQPVHSQQPSVTHVQSGVASPYERIPQYRAPSSDDNYAQVVKHPDLQHNDGSLLITVPPAKPERMHAQSVDNGYSYQEYPQHYESQDPEAYQQQPDYSMKPENGYTYQYGDQPVHELAYSDYPTYENQVQPQPTAHYREMHPHHRPEDGRVFQPRPASYHDYKEARQSARPQHLPVKADVHHPPNYAPQHSHPANQRAGHAEPYGGPQWTGYPQAEDPRVRSYRAIDPRGSYRMPDYSSRHHQPGLVDRDPRPYMMDPRQMHRPASDPRLATRQPFDNPNYYDPYGQRAPEPRHLDPRGQDRPIELSQKHHKGKPSPRGKEKDKEKDKKHSDKHKHGTLPRKDKSKEKDKKASSQGATTPEYLPINKVAPTVNYQPRLSHIIDPRYDHHKSYHPPALASGHPNSRGRPGVGVVFNPTIGATDF